MNCPVDPDGGHVRHMFIVGQPTCLCGERRLNPLPLHSRWAPSYKEDARSDVLLLMEDLKKGQPSKYILALEQIIDGVRILPLTEPAGPEDTTP